MPWAPGHLSPLDPITGSHPTFFHLTIQHGTEPTTSTYLYRTYWALAESNNSMEDENGDHLRSAPTLMTSEKGGLRFLWEMKGKKTGRFQHGNSSQCVVSLIELKNAPITEITPIILFCARYDALTHFFYCELHLCLIVMAKIDALHQSLGNCFKLWNLGKCIE